MTVFINQDTAKITVDQGTDNIRVVVPGVKGEGVPAGGSTGQVLAKVDNTDYNTEWVDGGGQGDFLTPQEVLAGSNVTVDTTTTPGSVIVSASDPGETNHALLLNRDAADSHPISAITGLDAALAGKLGPSQVLAGSNVTVDTVSSPGNVVVSASGTGGAAGYPDVISAADYGAVGDSRKCTATVAQGSTSVTISGTTFSTDGGESIAIMDMDWESGDGVPHFSLVTRSTDTTGTLATPAAKSFTGATAFVGTDDTTALLAARDAWLASFRENSDESGRIATKGFYIPPGDYLFSGTELFMRNDDTNLNRHRGGHVFGMAQGPGTRIIFASDQGPTQDRSLGNLGSFYWGALNYKMENISAFSMNKNQTFVWQFCSSFPLTGGQANFTWKDVELDGWWKSGWALDGDKYANMNSEQHWDHCTTRINTRFTRAALEFGGVVDSTVATETTLTSTGSDLVLADGTGFPSEGEGYIDSVSNGWRKIRWTGKTGNTLTGVTRAGTLTAGVGDVVVHASDQQDQFVNYQFLSCNYEFQYGDVFRIWKGGAITVIGGSWIIGVDVSPLSTPVGHFFHMPYATHFEVCFLQVYGTRFERRVTNTRLIKSYWAGEDTHITLDSIGMSDNHLDNEGPDYGPDSAIIELHANVDEGTNKMPNLLVRNSNILGNVSWDGTAAVDQGGLTFDQCDFTDWATTPIPTSGASSTGFLRWPSSTNLPRFRVAACSRVPNVASGISWETGTAVEGGGGGSTLLVADLGEVPADTADNTLIVVGDTSSPSIVDYTTTKVTDNAFTMTKPDILADGDHLFVFISGQSSSVTGLTMPTGFADAAWALASSSATRCLHVVEKQVVTASSEPATYAFDLVGNNGNRLVAYMLVIRGANATTPVGASAAPTAAGDLDGLVIPGATVPVDNCLAIGMTHTIQTATPDWTHFMSGWPQFASDYRATTEPPTSNSSSTLTLFTRVVNTGALAQSSNIDGGVAEATASAGALVVIQP